MKKKTLIDELIEGRKEDAHIVKTFYPKKKLNPVFFKKNMGNYVLDGNIRESLVDISDAFIDFIGIDFFVHDIILTGSLANYNWSKYSDVDIHIVVDFDDSEYDVDLLKEFFNSKKSLWNNTNDITVKGYDVEVYVQNSSEKHISSGVYSILNNEWINVPQPSKETIDERLILDKGEYYAETIDKLYQRFKKGNDVESEVSSLKKKIKKFRQSGLNSEGEYSYENLTFKLLRRNGYISKLLNIGRKIRINKLSLDENSPLPNDLNSFEKYIGQQIFNKKYIIYDFNLNEIEFKSVYGKEKNQLLEIYYGSPRGQEHNVTTGIIVYNMTKDQYDEKRQLDKNTIDLLCKIATTINPKSKYSNGIGDLKREPGLN